MKTLALVILAGASIAILSLSAPQDVDASKACARTTFETESVKKACQKGQDAAKKLMRDFMKEAKKKTGEKITCSTCHTKTSGDYPLKADGLKKYKEWGGK